MCVYACLCVCVCVCVCSSEGVVYVCAHVYAGSVRVSSLVPRLSPHTAIMKSKERESLVPFCT